MNLHLQLNTQLAPLAANQTLIQHTLDVWNVILVDMWNAVLGFPKIGLTCLSNNRFVRIYFLSILTSYLHSGTTKISVSTVMTHNTVSFRYQTNKTRTRLLCVLRPWCTYWYILLCWPYVTTTSATLTIIHPLSPALCGWVNLEALSHVLSTLM